MKPTASDSQDRFSHQADLELVKRILAAGGILLITINVCCGLSYLSDSAFSAKPADPVKVETHEPRN